MDLGFDLTATEEYSSFDLLPPGEYHVVIDGAEIRQTRGGDNTLSLSYRVMDGQFTNRKAFDNLNLWHHNQQCQQIAMSQLKSIRKSVGLNPNVGGTTEELLGRQMLVKLAIRKDKNDSTKEYQDFKGYKPLGPASSTGAAPMHPVPPQAAQQQAAQQFPWN
ncbi:MAG: DUF669 domain-containing protein [Desulfovibrio sp.]|nr:DUF669 domain-containing protein [Desulfovibrio sp.]